MQELLNLYKDGVELRFRRKNENEWYSLYQSKYMYDNRPILVDKYGLIVAKEVEFYLATDFIAEKK